MTKQMSSGHIVTEEKIRTIQAKMEGENLDGMSQLFKVLADQNRAKLLYALTEEEALCVHDLAEIANITLANASHHLQKLLKHRLVKKRKEGQRALYSLDDQHVVDLMRSAIDHLKEED